MIVTLELIFKEVTLELIFKEAVVPKPNPKTKTESYDHWTILRDYFTV